MNLINIYPAFEKNNIPIVFESSNYFIPYLSVALLTLIENTTDENNYDIIILGEEIDGLDKYKIMSLANNKENISIRFYNPYNFVKSYIDKAKFYYLSLNYYRMALPWILNNYDTAINLGADVLVKKDIAELNSVKFRNGKMLAGVRDLGYIGRLQEDIPFKELSLENPFDYINADVLVFNLKDIRNNYKMDFVMGFWQKYKLRCAEQDALNKLFDNNKQILDLKWNTFPERMTSTIDINCCPLRFINEWKKALKDPAIVHFAAVPKAWDYPLVGFGNDWWITARKTIYYEEILLRMNRPKSKKRRFINELGDIFLPLGSQRREFIKKFIPKKQWGLSKK